MISPDIQLAGITLPQGNCIKDQCNGYSHQRNQPSSPFGNSIRIYPEELIFLSTTQKLEFVKMVGERGALTNNKILQLFGLPPYKGGDVRLQSLNYVDVEIANEYQLANAGSAAVKKGITANE